MTPKAFETHRQDSGVTPGRNPANLQRLVQNARFSENQLLWFARELAESSHRRNDESMYRILIFDGNLDLEQLLNLDPATVTRGTDAHYGELRQLVRCPLVREEPALADLRQRVVDFLGDDRSGILLRADFEKRGLRLPAPAA